MNIKKVDSWDLKLPVLVLGIQKRDDLRSDFDFKGDKEWLEIFHQTAGVACHHKTIVGTILKPKKEFEEKLKEFNKEWYESNVGCFGSTLEELNKYNNQLKELFDVDCELSYKDFEEGLYPIDTHYVKFITDTPLPDELDDLINWEKPLDRVIGCIGRWSLWIIDENSD